MHGNTLSVMVRSFLCLLVPAFAGCGGDGDAQPQLQAGGSAGAASAGAGGNGGGVAGAAGAAGASGSGGVRTTAPLLVSSTITTGTTDVVADSNLVFMNGGDPPCPYALVGECHTWACSPLAPGAVLIDAGLVRLTGGGVPLSIARGVEGAYAVDRPTVEAWPLGASLTFEAGGGADVPAFSRAITAPGTGLTFAGTQITQGPTVWLLKDVDASVGLKLDWSAPTSGSVGVSITTTVTAPTAVEAPRLYCVFDASKGTATVPPAALAKLGGVKKATALVASEANAEVDAGGYRVLLRAARARRLDITFQ